MDTAAVAWAPREPTMAVSAKLTRVVKICSSRTGQASRMMVMAVLRDSSVTFSFFGLEGMGKPPVDCLLIDYNIGNAR